MLALLLLPLHSIIEFAKEEEEEEEEEEDDDESDLARTIHEDAPCISAWTYTSHGRRYLFTSVSFCWASRPERIKYPSREMNQLNFSNQCTLRIERRVRCILCFARDFADDSCTDSIAFTEASLNFQFIIIIIIIIMNMKIK